MRVTLKLATSLDGRIATASGESRWITGEAAREQVHKLRAMHKAVLIGIETAIADDPELTVRLPGYIGRQPSRVILDSRQRLPLGGKLVSEAGRLDTVVISTENSNDRLTDAGVTVLKVAKTDGLPDLAEALAALETHLKTAMRKRFAPSKDAPRSLPKPVEMGLATTGGGDLLVEGGGQVAASFLKAGLVDAIEWFRAPIILGAEGRPAVGGIELQRLADAPRFNRTSIQLLGQDVWERYERA